MSFWSPVSILYDLASETALKVVTDGADKLLGVAAKIRNASGTVVNPATQETLASLDGKDFATQTTLATLSTESKLEQVRVLLATIDADTSTLAAVDYATQTTLAALLSSFNAEDFASETTLAALKTAFDSRDLATQTTLAAVDTKLGIIDAVLDAIKDTDGIKKITDSLPAGLNKIGKFTITDDDGDDVGVTDAGGLRAALEDAAGNAITSIQDGSAWLLRTAGKVAQKADDSLHFLDMLDYGGVKATMYSKDGLEIAFPISSDDPSLLVTSFVERTGTGDLSDLRVDGSVTPVAFVFSADPTKDLNIIGFTFVAVANAMTFGSEKFAGLSALTNGVKVEVSADGSTGELALIKQNEDFQHYASIGGFDLLITSKDVLSSTVNFGGSIKLHAGTADKLTVTIQDDIDSGLDYFKMSVKAVKQP